MHYNNVQFSTTNTIFGYEIVEQKGIVFERVVSGVGLISEFLAGLTDVFGGRSGRMEEQLDSLYEELFSAMAKRAERVGANAIVGFSIDIDEISGKGVSMLMISGTGTAASVQRVGRITENKPVRKKEVDWKCTSCGLMNSWQSNYCPNCGERRHFEWTCKACNAENFAEFNYCPICGKKRTSEEEKVIDYSKPTLQKIDIRNLLETLQPMKNAEEILKYLKTILTDEDNRELDYFFDIMENVVRIERSYGNAKAKDDAIRNTKGFLENSCRVYPIDKEKSVNECPCCGSTIRNQRMNCFRCGALFRYLE